MVNNVMLTKVSMSPVCLCCVTISLLTHNSHNKFLSFHDPLGLIEELPLIKSAVISSEGPNDE